MPPPPIKKRRGANLPHWEQPGASYSVTFRLFGSLPQPLLKELTDMKRRHELAASQEGRTLTPQEADQIEYLRSERVNDWLDLGLGDTHMRRPAVADVVAGALRHFDGNRYTLGAWVVMPNHVHVVFTPTEQHTLSSILRSWKNFSAVHANKIIARSGPFWQAESYDHLIRSPADCEHALRYVLSNPAKAKLSPWPWVSSDSTAATFLTTFTKHWLATHTRQP